ncbi:MAG: aminotransferase class V-fold PLP-dependent enzyme [Chthoniobacterales bacterium]
MLRVLPFVEQVRRLAPKAVIAVDLTQALGRCVLDGVAKDADIVISSTHKWLLGTHGGCVVGVPERSAKKLTTTAGGWYHLQNAFDADRFERAEPKIGAASYSVGMPSFCRRLEETRILFSHMGLPGPLRTAHKKIRHLSKLASLPHVGVKLSAAYAINAYPHPGVPELMDFLRSEYGEDRLCWGSDFSPALDDVTMKQSIDVVASHSWKGSRKIMGGNLKKFIERVVVG